MASLRTCSHIKTNGTKCGSPALHHHTLCYFHYQWQRRDQRRIRLGSPAGMNKNTGIELPLLDGPEAILVSIMEIQAALLDQRIPIKMGTALLYSLQLALQARIPYSGLSGREPVRECPELEMELDMERAKSLLPAKEKCAACAKQDTCLSPRNCKKLPKLPTGYHREGDHLVRDRFEPEVTVLDATTKPSSRAESRSDVVEGPAFSPPGAPFKPAVGLSGVVSVDTTTPSSRAKVANCFSRAPGAPHLPQLADVGSAHATPDRARTENREQRAFCSNILTSNSSPLIDLPGKFPQLIETKQSEKQGVGIADSRYNRVTLPGRDDVCRTFQSGGKKIPRKLGRRR